MVFDDRIDRTGTASEKYDDRERKFGKGDVLPLWVADMDIPTPGFVLEAVRERAAHPVYGYTFADDRVKNATAGWLERRHDWKVEPSALVYSGGVVPNLAVAVRAFSAPGEPVIIQPPVYHPFYAVIEKNERKVAENRLVRNGDRYEMDFVHLEGLMAGGAGLLLFCSPHNPVGRVWSEEELTRLAELCQQYHVTVVSDEIHFDLVYPGFRHLPLATIPGMAERTVTLTAPSKTFNVAGLSASYGVVPDRKLRTLFRKELAKTNLEWANLFGLTALAAAYEHGDAWLDGLMAYLEETKAEVERFCREAFPLLRPLPAEATYLLWLDAAALGMDDPALREFLIREAGVGLSMGTEFGAGGEGFVRLNIGAPRSLVLEGLERIRTAWKKRGQTL